jgi:hypothetical protein
MYRLGRIFNTLKFIYAQRVSGLTPPGDVPFMAPSDADRFKLEVTKASRYVEFGSGGSTVFASRMGVSTISVENDRFFAREVARCLSGTSVRQEICEMGLVGEWGFPIFPSASAAKRYVSAPWDNQGFPDFVLVDGRYRVACALESARQANLVGANAVLMFDDYANRSFYHAVEKYLGSPEIVQNAAIFLIGPQQVPELHVEKWLRDPR